MFDDKPKKFAGNSGEGVIHCGGSATALYSASRDPSLEQVRKPMADERRNLPETVLIAGRRASGRRGKMAGAGDVQTWVSHCRQRLAGLPLTRRDNSRLKITQDARGLLAEGQC